ncbi:MAG TPA: hypothetical protein VK742_08800 [Candidatus Sulfotelmatobacter sp.]|jgi:hypothetical protein|nr:hypothetical protein [Candidatus Sulfotelmatobacter sp.]
MNPNWAEENLQTIRTLMERSAVYRRALAPIMTLAGIIGLVAAAAGVLFDINRTKSFGLFWLGVAVVAIVVALIIARRQAMKDREKFWSPPTRQVAQAMALPLAIGFILSLFLVILDKDDAPASGFITTFIWMLFYGSALYSAGFFMPRGIKIFGLIFVISALFLIVAVAERWLPQQLLDMLDNTSAHWLMGFFFGILHLAYGVYLYFTEKKNPVA